MSELTTMFEEENLPGDVFQKSIDAIGRTSVAISILVEA